MRLLRIRVYETCRPLLKQTIDVEGTKFRVLLGTSPEEVEIWRAERRKRWPTDANKARFVRSFVPGRRTPGFPPRATVP